MLRIRTDRILGRDTLRSQKLRALLTHRKLLQSKAIAVDNDLRATLRNFGLKVGVVGTAKFEARIKELVENLPDLTILIEPLLIVRRAIREQIGVLHRRVLAVVRDDDVCRRLMTVPGIGPVVALTYRVTVDVPARFRKSKSVGAVFGLTCAKHQSGENDRPGAISRCGRDGWPSSCIASGLTALSSDGPGRLQQREDCTGSNAIGGNSSSTEWWNDVPRGTMDEVSSYVRLDLLSD